MPETIRILCVDDEINILHTIRRQLADLDVELHLARSSEEGLQVMRRIHPVHVVVSDYRLPGMNGLEFLKCVFYEWPETTRILLSGFVDVEMVQAALTQKKLFALFNKPWKAAELQKTIAEGVELSLYRRGVTQDRLPSAQAAAASKHCIQGR